MSQYDRGRRFAPLEGRLPISFEEKYRVDPESGCWLWTAAISGGYGKVWFHRRLDYAHRVAYLVLVGPIPDDMQIDHLCRVRNCVNPDHLELVTQKENILRSTSPSAVHARKTHCPRGHEYDIVTKAGSRECRTCRRESQRHPAPPATTCYNGHPREDSYYNAKGVRQCRPCAAERQRRYVAKKRAS